MFKRRNIRHHNRGGGITGCLGLALRLSRAGIHLRHAGLKRSHLPLKRHDGRVLLWHQIGRHRVAKTRRNHTTQQKRHKSALLWLSLGGWWRWFGRNIGLSGFNLGRLKLFELKCLNIFYFGTLVHRLRIAQFDILNRFGHSLIGHIKDLIGTHRVLDLRHIRTLTGLRHLNRIIRDFGFFYVRLL